MKLDAIILVHKKPGLDPEELSNYRPISNLSFLDKLLEHAVAAQLKEHLASNDLFVEFHSRFWTNHSNESTIVRVTNDCWLQLIMGC